jgi:hypothetical protein
MNERIRRTAALLEWDAEDFTDENLSRGTAELLDFFSSAHLADEDLRDVSEAFARMAYGLVSCVKPQAERTAALRKLLESKDCAVRGLVADKRAAGAPPAANRPGAL